MSFGYQVLGFGSSATHGGIFVYEQSSNALNINVRTKAINAGWDGQSFLSWTLNSGVYSYTTGTAAGMTFNGSYPNGVELIIKGYVTGHGGDGGFGGNGGPTPNDDGKVAYLAMSASPSAGTGFSAVINVAGGRILGGGGGGAASVAGGGGGAGGGKGGNGDYNTTPGPQNTTPGSGGGGGSGASNSGPYQGTGGGMNALALNNGSSGNPGGGYGGGWGTAGQAMNRGGGGGAGAAISGSGYSLTNNGYIRGST